MNTVVKICFFALFAVILSGIVTPQIPAFKGYFSLGAAIVLFFCFFSVLTPLLNRFLNLFGEKAPQEIVSVAIKGLGTSFLVSVCASFCRDLGEEGIATKLELFGKAAILYLALPLMEEIIKMVEEILP